MKIQRSCFGIRLTLEVPDKLLEEIDPGDYRRFTGGALKEAARYYRLALHTPQDVEIARDMQVMTTENFCNVVNTHPELFKAVTVDRFFVDPEGERWDDPEPATLADRRETCEGLGAGMLRDMLTNWPDVIEGGGFATLTDAGGNVTTVRAVGGLPAVTHYQDCEKAAL